MLSWYTLASLALATGLVAGGDLQVGYPSAELVQCSLAQLQWSGSSGQTSVAVVDGACGMGSRAGRASLTRRVCTKQRQAPSSRTLACSPTSLTPSLGTP